MKLKLNTLVTSLITFAILTSCGSSSDKDKSSEFDDAKKTMSQEIVYISESIGPVTEIPYLLMATGAEYNQNLLNDRRRVLDYGSQMDKAALNLGIYAADIGYLCSYDKTQESIDYMNACKRLADNLGVTGTFDPSFLKEFESNIGNKDALAKLLDKAIKQTGDYLKSNNQSKLAALLIAGSFTESLYISTGIVKTYPKNTFTDPKQRMSVLLPLMRLVLKQGPSVQEVTKMLKTVDQTELIQSLQADLQELEASYATLHIDEKIKNSDPNMTFDDQTLSGITTHVEKLRGNIVK